MTTLDRSTCPGKKHGTPNAYWNYGCRCPDAADACRIWKKRRALQKHRGIPTSERVDPTGAIRRVQALGCMGWTIKSIQEAYGARPNSHGAGDFLRGKWISPEKHRRICKVYDELWDQPGPSRAAKQSAERKGWLPPLAWDDDQIDNPDHVPSMQIERDHAQAIKDNRHILERERSRERKRSRKVTN